LLFLDGKMYEVVTEYHEVASLDVDSADVCVTKLTNSAKRTAEEPAEPADEPLSKVPRPATEKRCACGKLIKLHFTDCYVCKTKREKAEQEQSAQAQLF